MLIPHDQSPSPRMAIVARRMLVLCADSILCLRDLSASPDLHWSTTIERYATTHASAELWAGKHFPIRPHVIFMDPMYRADTKHAPTDLTPAARRSNAAQRKEMVFAR